MTLVPVVAVVGPSGVGKDSVMVALKARDPGFRLVRRVITRPEQTGGESFEGVSETDFQIRLAADAFALSWRAHGLSYGIPAAAIAERKGARALLVNLSRGVLLRAQEVLHPLIVLSLTARPEVLAARLAARGREDAADQALRLGRAGMTLPDGLRRVVTIDNSGPLDLTVDAVLAQLQRASA
ncbi:phosphonate metabolism protein/1,5-bisphosphokinase (PRPP-forming) PhnN [Ruegeria marina]|uniref:Ribose 1,5-bisphosphate phosphokinase PhnN n=1 Tax=Ruegeria marina TaxID=639004 RepID=A0A1G6LSB7_9RHOB|nr:phosphonate metabolism protein/1,5-bisphosphokinase (PRPP-forming) PhnN [Ruegeria marina]SDC46081.1 ribose 1,5-bisphosphokinase [Ruegeria marina]